MNNQFRHLALVASVVSVVFSVAPREARAQAGRGTPPVAGATFSASVVLQVPLQLQNFDPRYTYILVACDVAPSNGLSAITSLYDLARAPGAVTNDNFIRVSLDHGGYSGVVSAHFVIVSAIRQQWTYACDVGLTRPADPAQRELDGTPGTAAAPLSSGKNLSTGTFTVQ
jgi:hypothetical protein